MPDKLRVPEAGGRPRRGRGGGRLAVLEAVVHVVRVGRLGPSPGARVEVHVASSHPAVGGGSRSRFAE